MKAAIRSEDVIEDEEWPEDEEFMPEDEEPLPEENYE